jgi:phage gp36-like protein
MQEKIFVIITISTIISIFVCYMKHFTKSVWKEFANPVAFYKKMVLKQVEIGVMDEDTITDNFKVESGFWEVMKNYVFWIEVFMLLLVPYPRFKVFP